MTTTLTRRESMTPTHLEYAKKRWGKRSHWIVGGGRWAVLARCRGLTVKLCADEETAGKAKKWIDDLGCGGACLRDHEIIDIGPVSRPPKTGPFSVPEKSPDGREG